MIVFPIRSNNGKIKMLSKGPFYWKSTKNRKKDIESITSFWVFELEKVIKKYPEQYFWVHRRFKTAPNGTRRDIYS